MDDKFLFVTEGIQLQCTIYLKDGDEKTAGITNAAGQRSQFRYHA
jgi:hypothetical protein